MADDDEAHGHPDIGAPIDEQFLPFETPQQFEQLRAAGQDSDAAFVEVGQRVARAAARGARRLHGGDVRGDDRPLGPRKGQPDQSVEEVVPVAWPRLDLAGFPHPALVGQAVRLRRHEADGLPVRPANRMTSGEFGQRDGIGSRRQLVEPAPQRVEQEG